MFNLNKFLSTPRYLFSSFHFPFHEWQKKNSRLLLLICLPDLEIVLSSSSLSIAATICFFPVIVTMNTCLVAVVCFSTSQCSHFSFITKTRLMTKMIQIWSLFSKMIVPHSSFNKSKWSFVFFRFFEFVYFMCACVIYYSKQWNSVQRFIRRLLSTRLKRKCLHWKLKLHFDKSLEIHFNWKLNLPTANKWQTFMTNDELE